MNRSYSYPILHPEVIEADGCEHYLIPEVGIAFVVIPHLASNSAVDDGLPAGWQVDWHARGWRDGKGRTIQPLMRT